MVRNPNGGVFTYTWRIENFSMCPQRMHEAIFSSDFVVDGLENMSWYLMLYPKGNNFADDYVSCFLLRVNDDEDEPDEMTNSFYFKVQSLETESHMKSRSKCTIDKTDIHCFKNVKSRIHLQKKGNTYLPNDVLTIVCYILWGTESFQNESEAVKISFPVNRIYALEEIATLFSGDKLPTQYRLHGLTYTTFIPVERSEIKWIIEDFENQMQTVKKISVSVVTKMRKKWKLLLHCYLSDGWVSESSVRIDIEMKDEKFKKMLLKCKVSVLNNKGTAHKYLEEQHIFGEDYEVLSFPSLIKVRDIENPEYELINDAALTLQCEFVISYDRVEDVEFNNDVLGNGLVNDIAKLLKDEKLTDVSLISEELEIPVHKSVISARSPVFRAMFTKDTEEKRTGVVHINDIEADTLKNLINFMYANDLPDLQPEDVMRLYYAADKYQFLVLKDWCSASLKYTLSISNVCEVLVFADMHEDSELLNYVHDFLRMNSLEVLESAEWMNLMKNNLKLTADTMRKIMINSSLHPRS